MKQIKCRNILDDIGSEEKLENDLILTSGEKCYNRFIIINFKKKKNQIFPLLGWQVPIITDDNHQKAKILKIDKVRIKNFFKDNDVLVIAGFQGINLEDKLLHWEEVDLIQQQ